MVEKVKAKFSVERNKKQVLQEKLKEKNKESNDLQKENQLLRDENKMLRIKLDQLEEEKRKERKASQLLQEKYTMRETQFNERIDKEIEKLKELLENLKVIAQKHGYFNSLDGLNLERESDDNNFPLP
ncbi:coiled-coil domain-containing protein 6-like [Actinia tenebrosa]|uniref:Coiled-coil domain-containing protein 6-like n=1 Tax=Actinia tenebrosa TaxID=6105 RepID=A0A6P8JCK3_ACTTE|nr:coiled-coil domain-containing protein 6-like [Actinia tenebrosa]